LRAAPTSVVDLAVRKEVLGFDSDIDAVRRCFGLYVENPADVGFHQRFVVGEVGDSLKSRGT